MIVGVPKETYPGERRVAMVPSVIPILLKAGCEVLVEKAAGIDAGYEDAAYTSKGAKLADTRAEVFATSDIVIQGTNPGFWHFHDHSDLSTTNNGISPGGMMTMLMYEDAAHYGVKVPGIVQVSS